MWAIYFFIFCDEVYDCPKAHPQNILFSTENYEVPVLKILFGITVLIQILVIELVRVLKIIIYVSLFISKI